MGNEHVGKNKTIPRIKSTYFNIDLEKNKISLKTKFSLKKDFQNILCRQFKRGIYKIYLEEIERQKGDGINLKYNFLKKFSRYDENDLPVFYFSRKTPIIIERITETIPTNNETLEPINILENKSLPYRSVPKI